MSLFNSESRKSWLTGLFSIASILIVTTRVSASDSRDENKQSLTVITHGLTLGPNAPEWTNELATLLRQQGTKCLVTDWAKSSRTLEPKLAQAAGEKLACRLANVLEQTDGKLHLHFIGFSRGTVVNSIAQHSLEASLSKRPQLRKKLGNVSVTMLDPHPANGKVGFFAGNAFAKAMTNSFEQSCNDPFPQLGRTTTQAFIYFQHATPKNISVNPFGWADAAKNSPLVRIRRDLTGVVIDGEPIEHRTVPNWYIRKVSKDRTLPLIAERD